MSKAMFGVIVVLVGILSIGSVYLRHTLKERDTAMLALEQTTVAMTTYVERAEAEVEGYAQATAILSEQYQEARHERDDMQARLEQADLGKMAKRHPDMLELRINAGTARLFNHLRDASGGTLTPENARLPETRAHQPGADTVEGH